MKNHQCNDRFMRLCEPAGRALLGCLFFLALTAIAGVLGFKLGPVYYSNSSFESAVKTEIARAGARYLDDETIVNDVIDLARRDDIRLKREDITLERFAGQVHLTVRHSVPVDFVLFEHTLNFECKASSFIGKF